MAPVDTARLHPKILKETILTTKHTGKEKILRILSMKILSEIRLGFVTIFSRFF